MADRQETLGSFRGDLLEEAVVQEFAADLRGELLRPEDDGYDTARAVFNGMIDRHPALIARCAGVAGESISPGHTTCRSRFVAVDTAWRATPCAMVG